MQTMPHTDLPESAVMTKRISVNTFDHTPGVGSPIEDRFECVSEQNQLIVLQIVLSQSNGSRISAFRRLKSSLKKPPLTPDLNLKELLTHYRGDRLIPQSLRGLIDEKQKD